MKNIVTKCLVLSALAIGMSSIVSAGGIPITPKLCNEATLIGRYHQHLMTPEGAAAGHYVFDGKGNGVATSTFHYIDTTKDDPVVNPVYFTYKMDADEDCKFHFTTGFSAERILYVTDSGDSASLLAKLSRVTSSPNSYEITRGPITSRQRLHYRKNLNLEPK
jgi:hypothetical protein